MWLSRPTEIDLESQMKPESYPNPHITLEVCTSLSFLLLCVREIDTISKRFQIVKLAKLKREWW